MSSTAVCGTAPPERMATGYTHPTRGAPVPQAAPRHHPSNGFSAGYLCSTAADLLPWQQALASGRALRPESFRQMSTPTLLASGRAAEQGDHLRAQPPGRQGAARMLYQGGDTFVAEHDPSLRLRFTMSGERAGDLVLQQGDREVARAPRLP